MNAGQIHLAGAIVAAFSFLVCSWQAFAVESVHWMWLLLLLAGIVAAAVTW